MSLDEPSTGNATRPVEPPSGGEKSDSEASTQPIADLPLFAEPAVIDDADSGPAGDQPEEASTAPSAGTHESTPDLDESGSRSDDDRPASLRDRLWAAGFDLAALAAALLLLVGVAAAMGVATRLANVPFYLPTWLAFGFLYQVLPLLFWGRTPGMMLAGLESRDPRGQPLTLQQATLRWLGNLFTWLLLGLPGLLAVTGRSFTDRLSRSHTLVSS